MRNKLREIINDMSYKAFTVDTKTDYLLEHDVIVMPCKVGDVLFSIHGNEIYEIVVTRLENKIGRVFNKELKPVGFCDNGWTIVSDENDIGIEDGSFGIWRIESIGKTLFKTREEAEMAISKG